MFSNVLYIVFSNMIRYATSSNENEVWPTTLVSAGQAINFVSSSDIVALGFFEDPNSLKAQNFLFAARELQHSVISFGITSSEEVFISYDIPYDSIMLFRFHGQHHQYYEGEYFLWVDIKYFVISNSIPKVIDFHPKSVSTIINTRKGTLYIFASSKSTDYNSLMLLGNIIAKRYQGRLYVVAVDYEKEQDRVMFSLLRVSKEEMPAVRYATSWSMKYSPSSSEITETSIKKFVDESLDGRARLITWKKSEEIPENWDKNHVKILVGKNFYEAVSTVAYSFVMFYRPGCEDCNILSLIWDRLGEKLKHQKDIMIGKMDALKNEVDNIWINRYPTFYLYKNTPLDSFKLRRGKDDYLEPFIQFLEQHGAYVKTKKNH